MALKNEEESLILFLNAYSNNDILKMIWNDKLIITCKVDTLYETDNGLALDDDKYEEYHGCGVQIIKIISGNTKKNFGYEIKEKQFIEINYHNMPDYIKDKDNHVLWENELTDKEISKKIVLK